MTGAGKVALGGPVFWFFVGLLFLAGMLAAFVVIDSLLRRRRGAYRAREPWWVYTIPQALYLLILLVVQFPFVPNWGGAVSFLLMPFALAEQFAYLLRVVFPKPPRPAEQPAPDAEQPASKAS